MGTRFRGGHRGVKVLVDKLVSRLHHAHQRAAPVVGEEIEK